MSFAFPGILGVVVLGGLEPTPSCGFLVYFKHTSPSVNVNIALTSFARDAINELGGGFFPCEHELPPSVRGVAAIDETFDVG